MRDDEQWVGGLVERSRALVPDVAVDVRAALRGGRRRRVQRRAFGGAGVVALAAGVGLGVPALPGPTTANGVGETLTVTPQPTGELVPAEIVDVADLPVCGVAPDASSDPTPGVVPADFEPVAVLHCRPLPQPGGVLVPTMVELTGDLGPLLDFLAEQEPVMAPPSECVVDFARLAPRMYLVDAAGRALAPHWPVDVCGRPAEAGIEMLDDLTVVEAGPGGAPPID